MQDTNLEQSASALSHPIHGHIREHILVLHDPLFSVNQLPDDGEGGALCEIILEPWSPASAPLVVIIAIVASLIAGVTWSFFAAVTVLFFGAVALANVTPRDRLVLYHGGFNHDSTTLFHKPAPMVPKYNWSYVSHISVTPLYFDEETFVVASTYSYNTRSRYKRGEPVLTYGASTVHIPDDAYCVVCVHTTQYDSVWDAEHGIELPDMDFAHASALQLVCDKARAASFSTTATASNAQLAPPPASSDWISEER